MKTLTAIILCFFFFGIMFAQNSNFEQYIPVVRDAKLVSDEANFRITRAYQSESSGITHIYFTQQFNDIDIFETNSALHLSKNGKTISQQVNFIAPNLMRNAPTRNSISMEQGLQKVLANFGYTNNRSVEFQQDLKRPNTFSFKNSDASEIEGKTMLNYLVDDEIKLVWLYLIQDTKEGKGWTVLVDAQSGNITQIHNWEQPCLLNDGYVKMGPLTEQETMRTKSDMNLNIAGCENCYEVFPLPYESPYEGDREILIHPEDINSSVLGWHDTEQIDGRPRQTTRGNNVDAYYLENEIYYQPDGGFDLQFTGYNWSENYTPQTPYIDASITNLFYLVNRVHDILYPYGFDEISGNFQDVNPPFTGEENDRIRANAQFATQFCNASFPFGPDGVSPLLKMNVCDTKDGSFDATVVIHELGHGVYGRLSGGPDTYLCSVNRERPTEGVADWLALMLTMKEGDTRDKPRYIAKYFFDQGIDGDGVRDFPYITDMAINPYTYNSIHNASIPHGVGEVWGTMLWDLTWDLIDEHGYNQDLSQFSGNYFQDAGNVMALAIVIEALKIQPCHPGFVDARDAVLLADKALYGGRNLCILWEAFARRGLGAFADQGDADWLNDGIESFEIPDIQAEFSGEHSICYDDITVVFGGGIPEGGIYSGLGVTDNGDGETFTLDLGITGPGSHQVFYEIDDGPCRSASSDDIFIEVFLDSTPPTVNCSEDVEVRTAPNTPYTLIDYQFLVNYIDNCDSGILDAVQTPAIGTLLDIGDHLIQFEIADYTGNVGSCQFMLRVREIQEDQIQNRLSLLPNPTRGILTLNNSLGLNLKSVLFYDVHGRLIKDIPIDAKQESVDMNIEEFADGMYFAILEHGSQLIVKQIIKM